MRFEPSSNLLAGEPAAGARFFDILVLAGGRFSLTPGTYATWDGEFLAIVATDQCLSLRVKDKAVREEMADVFGRFASAAEHRGVHAANAIGQLTSIAFCRRLAQRGLLRYKLDLGPDAWTEFQPGPDYQPRSDLPAPKSPISWSRFVYFQPTSNGLEGRSPLSDMRFLASGVRRAEFIDLLAYPRSPDEFVESWTDDVAQQVGIRSALDILRSCFMLTEWSDGITPGDRQGTLREWEFHDLLFHTASRERRSNRNFGATYRFSGETESPPFSKPIESPRFEVKLPIPDSELTDKMLSPFLYVLEGRRSIRTFEATPITLEHLAAFLYHTARIRKRFEVDTEQVCFKNYASGGALNELETYLIVENCEGLSAGCYYYNPSAHTLKKIRDLNALSDHLFEQAVAAMGASGRPNALIQVTARTRRVSWKYEGIAYSIVLKNVGALLQTMYLVGSALGLAPCAIGSGNSEVFALMTGHDTYDETAVGEFALGIPVLADSQSGDAR